MVRYEYKVFELDTGMFSGSSVPEEELNRLGANGWEVVAPINEGHGATTGFLLQRER